jgi:hypothetical protein
MKTSIVALCFTFLVPLSGLAQQPIARTSPLGAGLASAPNPPRLVNPAENTQINAVSGVPTQIFTWDPPLGGAAVTFYRFQFAKADDPGWAGPPPVRVEATGGRVSSEQIIPPALANARIRWSVRACNDQLAISAVGAAGGNCSAPVSRTLAWSTQAQPPQLLSPAPGAARFPNEQFTWSTAQGAASYLFCISRPGVACPTSEVSIADTIVERRVGNSTTGAAPDTSRFLGQTVNWTVASCGASGACSYQQTVRPVLVGGTPPSLTTPAHGAAIRNGQPFEWATVPWAAYYVLCISAPSVACPDPTRFTEAQVFEGSGTRLVYDQASRPSTAASTAQTFVYGSRNTRLNVDLYPLEGMQNWTVAACWKSPGSVSSAPAYCSYQSNVRAIRIDPRWTVSAKVSRVQVLDRCDNISKGDWNLSVFLNAPSGSDSGRWPHAERGSRDVDTGDVLSTPLLQDTLRAQLSGLGDDETVTFLMTGVDCDSEGAFTLSNVSGIHGVVNVVKNWTVQCGGEEVQEVTFGHDKLGEVSHQVRLAEHKATGSFRENVSITSGPGDCGSGAGAYTATFEISGARR